MARRGKRLSSHAPGTGARTPSRWQAGRTALIVLAVTTLGLGAWKALRPRALLRGPGLDVLLVTIDTLRADALGCYGNIGAETPRIDRLAASGVRFDFAHAHNVVTLPSHANILSGRYPFDHRVRENSGFRFPQNVETLATLLKGHGYRTGAFVSAFPLDSRFGLDRGFDVYDDRLGDFETKPDFQMQERPGTKTVAAALAWLKDGAGPTFCWVHLYEPHAPYDPPPEYRSRFPRAYDGEVAAADAALAPLLDPLLGQGRASRTLIVLTADHGEGLGEHGEATHGIFAYEATLRVPLILHQPGLFAPRVVSESVRHVDLLPTILDALALPAAAATPGRSLLALAEGNDSERAPVSYFESLSPALTRGWAPIYGVLRDRYKYVELPIPELYDLAADAAEQGNLAARQPVLLEDLRTLLARERSADPGVTRVSEGSEVRERLASLGYVTAGSGIKATYGEQDDPKRNVDFEGEVQQVLDRYAEGDLVGARASCEKLVRLHPASPLALRHVSFLRRQTGDLAGAVEAARRAVAADPGSAESVSQLGNYLNEVGRPQETVKLLAPYAQRSDVDLDVLMAYAAAVAQTGRRDEALAALERARRADPSNAMVLHNIGTVRLMFGDRAGAREAFAAALDREPELVRAYSSLGVIAAQSGEIEKAVQLWKRTLAINPKDPDTLYNIGKLLWTQGRRAEARAYLERFTMVANPTLYRSDIAYAFKLLNLASN
jgi:arylsulfatase A-like enzyme/Tfp pilus assembly protein PilF